MLSRLVERFWQARSTLIAIKYIGLSIAAASSLWGTVTDLTVEVAGHKQLTIAGIVAIGMTLLGLAVSILSEDVQRRIEARERDKARRAEAKRTNDIIIAGQQLRSLHISWKFEGVPDDVADAVGAAWAGAIDTIMQYRGTRTSDQNGAIFRADALYPALSLLGRRLALPHDEPQDWEPVDYAAENVVALFSLDDDNDVILPFGYLDPRTGWGDGWALASEEPMVPSVEEERHDASGNGSLPNAPDLMEHGKTLRVDWRVDPATFSAAINRQSKLVTPTAKLPDLVFVALLFDIGRMPFKGRDLSAPLDTVFWACTPDTVDTDAVYGDVTLPEGFTSSLELIPNNSSIIRFDYDLFGIRETLFVDDYGHARRDVRCLVFGYELKESEE